MLKSVILQMDDDTLIVSQQIPQDFVDEKTFHSCNVNIEYVSELKFCKKKDSSLLDMFESPVFDIHMIFKYLQTQNKTNIIEYLMNKMFREYRNDVKMLDFYLPQLW